MDFHCVDDPLESQEPLTNSGNLFRGFGGNVLPQVTGRPLNYGGLDCNWLDNNVFNVHMACAVVWDIFKFKTYLFRLPVLHCKVCSCGPAEHSAVTEYLHHNMNMTYCSL